MHECRRGTLEGTWQASHSGSIDDDDEAVSWKAKKKISIVSIGQKEERGRKGRGPKRWMAERCMPLTGS